MELPNIGEIESLGVLFALLPGLLTYLVIRLLTAKEKELDAIEVILNSLAYDLVVHAIWSLLKLPPSRIPTPDIVGLSLTALVVGVVLSAIITRGLGYRFFRWLRITSQADFPSIWETAFRVARIELGTFVVLYLDDGRRVMGAVRGISSDQESGHICLDKAKWIVCTPGTNQNANEQTVQEIPGWFLVPTKDLKAIQFLPRLERSDGKRTGVSATASPPPPPPGRPDQGVKGDWWRTTPEISPPPPPPPPPPPAPKQE